MGCSHYDLTNHGLIAAGTAKAMRLDSAGDQP